VQDTIKPVQAGAGLRLHAQCTVGHRTTFNSCEFINNGRSTIIDVKLSVLQLLTGLSMSPILEFFRQLGLATCSRTTMYNIQSVFVNPTVFSFWTRMQEAVLDRFRCAGRPISITGDGQYDSPGFSAAYCFYSIVEAKTKKIIDFFVAEKSMAEYSAKLEPLAAKVLLARLHKKRVNIRVCTTDRSSQLKKLLIDVNQVKIFFHH
jgi:hypothetical protein